MEDREYTGKQIVMNLMMELLLKCFMWIKKSWFWKISWYNEGTNQWGLWVIGKKDGLPNYRLFFLHVKKRICCQTYTAFYVQFLDYFSIIQNTIKKYDQKKDRHQENVRNHRYNLEINEAFHGITSLQGRWFYFII